MVLMASSSIRSTKPDIRLKLPIVQKYYKSRHSINGIVVAKSLSI